MKNPDEAEFIGRDWYKTLCPFQGERSIAAQTLFSGNLGLDNQDFQVKKPAWRLNAPPEGDEEILYQSRR